MDIFAVVLQSVLVLLGIGVIGFWITRRGIIPENVLNFLSRLAIDIALPCMVFSSIMANFSPDKFPDWWQLPLWWLLFAGISLVISLMTMFLSQKETRSEFAMNLFYQNGLFFPLIIISGVFGTDAVYLPQLYIFQKSGDLGPGRFQSGLCFCLLGQEVPMFKGSDELPFFDLVPLVE